jgi:hypothetical protein
MQPSETSTQAPATVSLADEEGVKRVLIEAMFSLWSTANNLSRLHPSKRERYRVTIFGSARTHPGHWVYAEVKRMAGELAALGCDIVTGGGPGPMWRELVDWAGRYMLRPGFELAKAEDMTIPRCVDTADESVAIIREHHGQWQLRQGRPVT